MGVMSDYGFVKTKAFVRDSEINFVYKNPYYNKSDRCTLDKVNVIYTNRVNGKIGGKYSSEPKFFYDLPNAPYILKKASNLSLMSSDSFKEIDAGLNFHARLKNKSHLFCKLFLIKSREIPHLVSSILKQSEYAASTHLNCTGNKFGSTETQNNSICNNHMNTISGLNSLLFLLPEILAPIPEYQHTDYYFGREDDLKALAEKLDSVLRGVLISGVGGIGKTALAEAYVNHSRSKYKFIVWIDCSGGSFPEQLVLKTDLEAFLKINVMDDDRFDISSRCRDIIDALRRLVDKDRPSLLVLDNIDSGVLSWFNALPLSPEWHLLATSREQVPRFCQYELPLLNTNDALAIFKHHYDNPLTQLQENDIKLLLERIDHIPLVIELLAKIAKNQSVPVHELLSYLDCNRDLNHYITHAKNKVQNINFYLQDIFKVHDLSAAARYVLSHFVSLPPGYYELSQLHSLVDTKRFNEQHNITYNRTLSKLHREGWLFCGTNFTSFKLPYVIANAIRPQLDAYNETMSPVSNPTHALTASEKQGGTITDF